MRSEVLINIDCSFNGVDTGRGAIFLLQLGKVTAFLFCMGVELNVTYSNFLYDISVCLDVAKSEVCESYLVENAV